MNRSKKIKDKVRELATAAGQVYLTQKTLDPEARSEIIARRTKLYANREVKRMPADLASWATERILLGSDESKDVAPNDSAEKFGVPVARMVEIGKTNEPKGFASGFLVAPNILITNHHVFSEPGDAINCAANFGYQRDRLSKAVLKDVSFALQPDEFFYSNKALDFSLVSVARHSLEGDMELSSFGYLPLIGTKGKVKINSPINLVHYPGGGLKKFTTEENLVTEINDDKGFIFYTTDTEKGSSGSPCANIHWEVAALHFTSVPRVNAQGQWLTKSSDIVDPENTDESDIDWVANAGISISKIVAHLREVDFPTQQKEFIDRVLGLSVDPLEAKPIQPKEKNENQLGKKTTMETEVKTGAITMNFYGNTTVYVSTSDHVKEKAAVQDLATRLPGSAEKKETFDEDYNTREGYEENFLKGFRVPMPAVKKERQHELLKKFGSRLPYVIPYHHYSLVMNKERRMCMWTAANADYRSETRDNRERKELGNGAWRFDPRIPEKYQIGAEEFYDPATLVDKGHIVRRDDNCWWESGHQGVSKELGIEYANADTFHWTNCTPQHEAFNRDTAQYTGVGLWGVLENAIKGQLDNEQDIQKDYGQRACILAGPVLSPNDPEYNGIQYPLAFWKVFAIRSKSAGNLVYGFVLSQEEKVETDGLEKEGIPRWNAKVQAMRRSLKEIESVSGVLFDESLHKVDTMKGKQSNKPFSGSL
ncbi:MAG: DNA/RNA non-specific endonuclease [Cytophagales bacterium]|nr:DNA/RNA non-specific endonuclease [Cytophagales bacterium]